MATKQKDTRTRTTAHRRLKLDVPERQKDEEPATEKQLAYIRHLAAGAKPEHSEEDLGKWQAWALIDQIKEEKERFETDVDEEIWEEQEQDEKEGITGRQIFWAVVLALVMLVVLSVLIDVR